MHADATQNLTQEDVVLLIAAGADGDYPLDPIRVMKGCFLVTRRGKQEWRSLFSFQPYDYGPFDSAVYRARNSLVAQDLLEEDGKSRHGSHTLTEDGRARVAELREQIGDTYANWFAQIGKFVTERSFSKLLDDVYAEYPDYAKNSLYSG